MASRIGPWGRGGVEARSAGLELSGELQWDFCVMWHVACLAGRIALSDWCVVNPFDLCGFALRLCRFAPPAEAPENTSISTVIFIIFMATYHLEHRATFLQTTNTSTK